MHDAIKAQAVAIAKSVNEGTSYACGSWWTNSTMAIKLSGAIDRDQVLSLACQCGTSGCGCGCAACSNCVYSEPYCDELRACPTATATWSDDGHHRAELIARHPDTLVTTCAGLAATPVTIKRKTVFGIGRCIMLESGVHADAGFQIHANLKFLAAARRHARVSRWSFVANVGEHQKIPILLGYRQGDLVALVMPFQAGSACTEAA